MYWLKWRFVYVYVNRECCDESAPATTVHLCNHQCVVSMRLKCSQCVVIRFLNKTFASLPRKKIESGNRFLMLFLRNMITAALRHAVTLEKSTCHGQTPQHCQICRPNKLNQQLRGRTINCNVTDGLCARCHHK